VKDLACLFGQEIVGEEGTPCNAVRDRERHQVDAGIAKKAIDTLEFSERLGMPEIFTPLHPQGTL